MVRKINRNFRLNLKSNSGDTLQVSIFTYKEIR